MISLKSTTALLVIAALVAIGPLSLNMFLPALPTMRVTFAVPMEDIQLTLTLYLIGFALAQLICGPLADRFGRKPVILIGLICFLVASIACTYSTSLEELLVFRVIQSFGACVGPVLGRTMIRDVYGATESASVLSYLTSIIALAPAVAPMLGALINEAFDWRAIFIALSIIAALIGAIYFFLLPETLPAEERQQIEIKEVFGNYSVLLKDRIFVAYLLCGCIGFSGIFTYMAAAPFVLMEYFGIPESIFCYYYIVVVSGYIVGSLLGGRSGRAHV